MTRITALENVPQSQIEGMDKALDGGTGLTENAGGLYQVHDNATNRTTTYVDTDNADFKEKYIAHFKSKRGDAGYLKSPIGAAYMKLLDALDPSAASSAPAAETPQPASAPTPGADASTAAAPEQPKGTVTSTQFNVFGDNSDTTKAEVRIEWLEEFFKQASVAGDPDFQDLALYRKLAAFAETKSGWISADDLKTQLAGQPVTALKLITHFRSETSYSEHVFASTQDTFTVKIFTDKRTQYNSVLFYGADKITLRQFKTGNEGVLEDVESGEPLSQKQLMLMRMDDQTVTALLAGLLIRVIGPNDPQAAEVLGRQLPLEEQEDLMGN